MSLKTVLKKVGKGIWTGIKVAEPYLAMAAAFLPAGSPVVMVLTAIETLVNRAENEYPEEGSGQEKAEFVSLRGLQVAEIATGKNVNNPKTRAIVEEIGRVTADIKNVQAMAGVLTERYKKLAEDLKDALESAKDKAIDDAP